MFVRDLNGGWHNEDYIAKIHPPNADGKVNAWLMTKSPQPVSICLDMEALPREVIDVVRSLRSLTK